MTIRLKQWLSPLRGTPLHPQWLIYRGEYDSRRFIGKVPQGKVLDIGCGDRWVERALPPGTAYVGLDYPPTVSLGYAGRPDVFADAQRLPFPNDSFDTVILMDVLEHLPQPEAAIVEARRALKPGGTLVVQVPFLYPLHDEPHDYQRWTVHGLHTMLRRHHLDVQTAQWRGQPSETGAALMAIAMARGIIDATTRPTFAVLLLPLLAIAIPLINLIGWLLARILPSSPMMPLGYYLVAVRNE